MGCGVVTGFMGSPIWKSCLLLPADDRGDDRGGLPEDQEALDADPGRVRRAAGSSSPSRSIRPRSPSTSTRPSGCWRRSSTAPALGFNFDPSHLLWQGLEPHLFIREFPDRIYHVHMKDAAVTLDGRPGSSARISPSATCGAAGTSAPSATATSISRRSSASSTPSATAGRSRSSGRTTAWTASSGPKEALEFVRSINFAPSSIAFDKDMKKRSKKSQAPRHEERFNEIAAISPR